jgi:predicted nucleic acid-binding protein
LNVVVDSYAWIELFLGSEKGEKVQQIMLGAEEIRTPDIVLAEISRKYQREKFNEKRVRSRLEVIGSTSLVTPVTITIALRAGKAYFELTEKAKRERRRSPSLFDAIVLATAREYDSKVLTGDQHFESLPETILI